LRRADRIVSSGAAETLRLRQLGIPEDQIAVIPPGVVPPSPPLPRVEICRRLGVAEAVRLIVVVGPLQRYKGGYEAIWAFDILGQLFDDLHLVLVGEGRERLRLQRFAAELRGGERVHVVGWQADVSSLVAAASVVWAPVLKDAGHIGVLEAMAAGVPVVASRWPGLEELIVDGETGALMPPGEKAGLGRQTRLLLENEQRRRQMGDAARRRATEHFSAEALYANYARLFGNAV
jgi:glycosyltransferase involved in cell wall biosynthesis